GPFPVGEWEHSQQPGLSLAVSGTGAISRPARHLADESRSLIAVFDGVLFNRDEVIQTLARAPAHAHASARTDLDHGQGQRKGATTTRAERLPRNSLVSEIGTVVSPSDADLLLAGYRCWGRKVVDHLNGDFAFALWDGECNALFAAVDPFGLRPFYFAVG